MQNKKRESNLELMRIIMMLVIIAHHYVVNSGIQELYNFSNITPNMIFLQCIGFAGKIMINCFILITGYFMINKKITFEKILKLYLEIKFYKSIIYIILIVLGVDTFSKKGFVKTVFNIIYGVNVGFTGTYFLLYLLIPFINIFINGLNKKQFGILLGILLFYFTFISTFSFGNDTFNEITWYIVVYMIGAYISLYPSKYDKNKKIWLFAVCIYIATSIISILGIDFFNNKFNATYYPYFFVVDAHKILAVVTSISLFMLFKNINFKYNKVINTIASTTFGVLLIHANSDAMRTFIWQNIFDVKGQYNSPNLWIHAILTISVIYVVCVFIDLLRIKFIEKSFFNILKKSKKYNIICEYVDKLSIYNGGKQDERR